MIVRGFAIRTASTSLAVLTASLLSPAHAQDGAGGFDPVNVAGVPRETPQGKIVLPPPTVRSDGAETVSDLGTALQLTTRLPSLLAEESRERASLARVDQAKAAFGPTIDGEASYGYARDRFDTSPFTTEPRSGWSWTARAALSQTIFSSGQLTAGLRGAEAERELQRQARRQAENQALLSSVSAYVGLQRDLALLKIAQENQALLSEQARSSSERFDKRELTAVDYDQVRARLESSRADLATAEASADIARGRFLQAIGAPAGELAPAPPPLALMPPSLEEAQAVALAESPLVVGAHARERASREQLHAAQGAMGPVVSLQGEAQRGSRDAYGTSDLNQTLLRGSVNLRMPIYDSGRRYAASEAAKATNDADVRLIDQAVRDTQFSVQSVWDRYSAGIRSIASLREAVKAAEGAYNGAVLQEKAGLVTTLDILILLRDLLQVRSQLVAAEADAQVSRYSLLAVMGRLEFDRLNVVAAPHNDVPPLNRVSEIYTLPAGPAAYLIDSLVAGTTKKPPKSRDGTAATARLPGLPAPDPADPITRDATISAPTTQGTPAAP